MVSPVKREVVSMQTGAITGYIDVAQVVLYAFWVSSPVLSFICGAKTNARLSTRIRSSGTARGRRLPRHAQPENLSDGGRIDADGAE